MILDGKKLKEEIINSLKISVDKLDSKPTLCVIQVGDNEASNVYINQKKKMCENIGYNFIHKKYEESISEEELINNINKFNSDTNINGILVQMPLPENINPKNVQNAVLKDKDVDGLNDGAELISDPK